MREDDSSAVPSEPAYLHPPRAPVNVQYYLQTYVLTINLQRGGGSHILYNLTHDPTYGPYLQPYLRHTYNKINPGARHTSQLHSTAYQDCYLLVKHLLQHLSHTLTYFSTQNLSILGRKNFFYSPKTVYRYSYSTATPPLHSPLSFI